MKISIVFPCFNEEHNSFFKKALNNYYSSKNLQLICVDGGSSDNTLLILAQYPQLTCLSLPNSSRAARLNLGLQHAKGDIVILHHPRSMLDIHAFEQLKTIPPGSWGGFTHCFDQDGLLYRFTSWYSNKIRLRYRKIVYLDHCIFAHRDLLKKKPLLDDVKIFEDTLLSKKLNQFSKPILLSTLSTTSSIRFKKNGLLKQILLNQIAKILFYIGVHPNKIDKLYEKNLSLNFSYKE